MGYLISLDLPAKFTADQVRTEMRRVLSIVAPTAEFDTVIVTDTPHDDDVVVAPGTAVAAPRIAQAYADRHVLTLAGEEVTAARAAEVFGVPESSVTGPVVPGKGPDGVRSVRYVVAGPDGTLDPHGESYATEAEAVRADTERRGVYGIDARRVGDDVRPLGRAWTTFKVLIEPEVLSWRITARVPVADTEPRPATA